MNCLRLIRPMQTQKLCKHRFVKYFSQHPSKFLETQDKWREKDGVSKNWQLIYKSPMNQVLNYSAAYLTASTTMVTVSALYYGAFVFDVKTMNEPVLLGGQVVVANNTMEFFVYVAGYFIFHFALKALLSKLVVRLYNNGDDYLAIFRGNWYDSIVKHKFHLQEFKKLSPTIVVSWGESRFQLGNKHGILIDKYFKTPEHYNYLIYKKKS